MSTLSVRVPEALRERVDSLCAALPVASRGGVVRALLERGLELVEKRPATLLKTRGEER